MTAQQPDNLLSQVRAAWLQTVQNQQLFTGRIARARTWPDSEKIFFKVAFTFVSALGNTLHFKLRCSLCTARLKPKKVIANHFLYRKLIVFTR
jgi:hypothetical protein